MDSRISSLLRLASVRIPASQDRMVPGSRTFSMRFTFCLCWPIIRSSMQRYAFGQEPKIPPGWMICSFEGNRQARTHSVSPPRCWWSKMSPMTSDVPARPVLRSCGMRSRSARNLDFPIDTLSQYSIWSFARNPCTTFAREMRASSCGFHIPSHCSGTMRYEIDGSQRPVIYLPRPARTGRRRSSCIRTEDRGVLVRGPRPERRHERSWARRIRLQLQRFSLHAERCRNGGYSLSNRVPCVDPIVWDEIRSSFPTTELTLPRR